MILGLAIRAYAASDAAACARILDRAWHAGHPHAPRVIDVGVFAADTEGERILVAEARGAIVGFASVYRPARFIHHLYVDPAVHRHGIGRALLAHAVALAGGRASLKCQCRNRAALAFYRHLGWTPGETGESDAGPWVRLHSP